MISNIKSTYITISVLSIIDEKTKLGLVKYNKNLQNLLDIKLINYKRFSGKYIVYDENKIGKEYYKGKIIYIGEYLNGERSGKGKEYYNEILLFEGEYLKGKRNGKGKEYYEDGNILFEGDYINGKKWKGKGYDPEGEILYELKEGKGDIIEYNIKGKKLYIGEYLNGERNGEGVEYFGKTFFFWKI